MSPLADLTLQRAKRDRSRIESGRIRAEVSDWNSTIEFQTIERQGIIEDGVYCQHVLDTNLRETVP